MARPSSTTWILIATATVALAGCVKTAPADATFDDHPAVPGAQLAVWLEALPDRLIVHGLFDNDSGEVLTIYNGYHLGPWNLTIFGPDGEPVIFNPRLSCRDYDYSFVADKEVMDFQFTWGYVVYDALDVCKTGREPASTPAPPGDYTARIQFLLAHEPDDSFEVRLPFAVAAPDDAGSE